MMLMTDQEIKPVNELWTAEQAGVFLHRAPSTIRKYVKLRQIPYVRIGGENLFDPEALKAWAGQQRVPARTAPAAEAEPAPEAA